MIAPNVNDKAFIDNRKRDSCQSMDNSRIITWFVMRAPATKWMYFLTWCGHDKRHCNITNTHFLKETTQYQNRLLQSKRISFSVMSTLQSHSPMCVRREDEARQSPLITNALACNTSTPSHEVISEALSYRIIRSTFLQTTMWIYNNANHIRQRVRSTINKRHHNRLSLCSHMR